MAALSHFLNLDLVLKSKSDFTSLIAHLDERVHVLHHQEHEQEFLLVLETNGTGSPQGRLLDRHPRILRRLSGTGLGLSATECHDRLGPAGPDPL
ncbi:hypothetical protein [Bradyrhizobium sp. SZCCHNS3052]|uniref:hypothetical protein n=1 Tax=Bradyrhizobium sp. SZCCHNS3052 TaxID=3057321 RepID=UPI002915F6C3|nr:hypothetical protein [Bradyrhizobium sp. SZCCHNS3052]